MATPERASLESTGKVCQKTDLLSAVTRQLFIVCSFTLKVL